MNRRNLLSLCLIGPFVKNIPLIKSEEIYTDEYGTKHYNYVEFKDKRIKITQDTSFYGCTFTDCYIEHDDVSIVRIHSCNIICKKYIGKPFFIEKKRTIRKGLGYEVRNKNSWGQKLSR